MNTILMNKSGLSDEIVKPMIDRLFESADEGVWRVYATEHTNHKDEMFPCINDFGREIQDYNVLVETK